jgi:hypothetical protein
MQNTMVDLETLGTVPGCVILSIGAVAFDPMTGQMDEGFYTVIHRPTCTEAFLTVDPATEAWWRNQGAEARVVLEQSQDKKCAVPLRAGLAMLNDYLNKHGGKRNARLWGNGADFDNAILSCAYDAVNMKPGWEFWNNRCYRTLKNLAPATKLLREGTYHNALDDARSQVKHLLLLREELGLKLN